VKQLEQLQRDLQGRTEALSKRRDELQALHTSLRMGIVSASSDDACTAPPTWDEDSLELARFARVIDMAPPRATPQDERLAAAAATIARLQPVVTRFDRMFLQVSCNV
jgi:hypothetical protein